MANERSVRRYPTLNARSPNGPNPREGRAVDSLGPTRTLVGGDSCAPTLVFCLECRVLVSPSTALSCLAVVPVVCYSTRATRALRAVFMLGTPSTYLHSIFLLEPGSTTAAPESTTKKACHRRKKPVHRTSAVAALQESRASRQQPMEFSMRNNSGGVPKLGACYRPHLYSTHA